MLRLITRRLLVAIPLLLAVTLGTFALIDLAPGNPAVTLAGEDPDPTRVAYLEKQLRLDDPLPVRWAEWVGKAAQGDLGQSLQNREPVDDLVWRRLGVTLSLLLVAVVFAMFMAFALAIAGASRPGGLIDHFVSVLCSFALAAPPFWIGLFLVLTFSVNRNWLPAFGYAPLTDGVWPWFERLILPGLALSAFLTAEFALQLRNSLQHALGQDYIVTATAKGLSRRRVLFKHALKNAAAPLSTIVGLRIAVLVGGTATIESMFGLRGIGDLAVNATLNRDVTVMLGVLLVTCVLVQLVNLVADILHGYFNPKVRT